VKIVELLNKLQVPLSNEESDVLNIVENRGEIEKPDFSERQLYVANQLVNKDVLLRTNQNGRILYTKKSRKNDQGKLALSRLRLSWILPQI
jgi:hypothetical protein